MKLTATLRYAIRQARDQATRDRLRIDELDSRGRRKVGAVGPRLTRK